MRPHIQIALAQINPIIGDTLGNTNLIINALKKADNASIVAFPEMAIIGYPAQDLLFNSSIIDANLNALDTIKPHTKDFSAVIVGFCHRKKDNNNRDFNITNRQMLYNSYAVFSYGELVGFGDKICLPSYGVFDDSRYFIPGDKAKVFELSYNKRTIRLGVLICEDIWYKDRHPVYPFSPIKQIKEQNADFLIVINASPFELGKDKQRHKLIQEQALENSIPIFYVNMWGGNDKIIFDGNSFAVDKNAKIIAVAKSFGDDILRYNLDLESKSGIAVSLNARSEYEDIFDALVLGKRDYHRKCSINKSIIGVSGGIDSALVLAIDVGAIGKENVLAIISPSRYTSRETLDDAVSLCKRFDVAYKIIPIETKENKEKEGESATWSGVLPEKYKRYEKHYGIAQNAIVFENMQAIDRMSILRAIANEDNRLVSGTGNKTELAVGYATVCGDLQADILVIGDLYKGQVYELAHFVNKIYKQKMIPNSIIKRTPSAELAPNQTDPFDYDRLDLFVKLTIEGYLSNKELLEYKLEKPFSKEEIKRYSNLINKSEHKRFKSGYILKVSAIAFGEDRRINTAKKITLV